MRHTSPTTHLCLQENNLYYPIKKWFGCTLGHWTPWKIHVGVSKHRIPNKKNLNRDFLGYTKQWDCGCLNQWVRWWTLMHSLVKTDVPPKKCTTRGLSRWGRGNGNVLVSAASTRHFPFHELPSPTAPISPPPLQHKPSKESQHWTTDAIK